MVTVDSLYIIIGYTFANSHKCTLEIIGGEMNFKRVSNEATFPSSCVTLGIFSVDKKNQLDVTFVFFISLLIVAQHVSGNHVPIIRSRRLRDIIASFWYVPWLQEGCQDRLAGSTSMDGFVAQHSCDFPYPH